MVVSVRRALILTLAMSASAGLLQEPADAAESRVDQMQADSLLNRELIAQLVRMQYQRNDQALSRARFRVRGDTLELAAEIRRDPRHAGADSAALVQLLLERLRTLPQVPGRLERLAAATAGERRDRLRRQRREG